jgi:hypothetical protein
MILASSDKHETENHELVSNPRHWRGFDATIQKLQAGSFDRLDAMKERPVYVAFVFERDDAGVFLPKRVSSRRCPDVHAGFELRIRVDGQG